MHRADLTEFHELFLKQRNKNKVSINLVSTIHQQNLIVTIFLVVTI